mmetsp:Transcript_3627/g.6888  ORF Transcript_3627/g.6888 Transcript_3627/m.6888 type:complete len:298 (-) Transcript_3627:1356-2249(-)
MRRLLFGVVVMQLLVVVRKGFGRVAGTVGRLFLFMLLGHGVQVCATANSVGSSSGRRNINSRRASGSSSSSSRFGGGGVCTPHLAGRFALWAVGAAAVCAAVCTAVCAVETVPRVKLGVSSLGGSVLGDVAVVSWQLEHSFHLRRLAAAVFVASVLASSGVCVAGLTQGVTQLRAVAAGVRVADVDTVSEVCGNGGGVGDELPSVVCVWAVARSQTRPDAPFSKQLLLRVLFAALQVGLIVVASQRRRDAWDSTHTPAAAAAAAAAGQLQRLQPSAVAAGTVGCVRCMLALICAAVV